MVKFTASLKITLFVRDTQVEVPQLNILVQAGEIRLLRHFSGLMLKTYEYADSLYLWPLLQGLFTHITKSLSFYLTLQLVSVALCPTIVHLRGEFPCSVIPSY